MYHWRWSGGLAYCSLFGAHIAESNCPVFSANASIFRFRLSTTWVSRWRRRCTATTRSLVSWRAARWTRSSGRSTRPHSLSSTCPNRCSGKNGTGEGSIGGLKVLDKEDRWQPGGLRWLGVGSCWLLFPSELGGLQCSQWQRPRSRQDDVSRERGGLCPAM